ncbi:hypothetical protein BHE74_00033834 [Ensete ventricosum]|nr:hypothetical protein BHE74_00033834 [Ensete ventricosum]
MSALLITVRSLQLPSLEGLPELPPGGRDVVAGDRPPVAGGHLEGEALPVEVGVALPVLAPVARHGLPPGLGPLDRHRMHVAGPADVGDQHQVEVGVAVDGEPYASLLHAGPAEGDGDDAGAEPSDLEEGGLGEVEVLQGRVAPSAVVVGEGVVGGAEVGGGDDDGGREAPPGIVGAPHLVAGAAAEPVAEERGAEGGGVGSVALAVEVAVAASPSCGVNHAGELFEVIPANIMESSVDVMHTHGAGGVASAVERGVGVPPSVGLREGRQQEEENNVVEGGALWQSHWGSR